MKTIVHLGLGKCATTMLQKHVLPSFASKHGQKFFGPNSEPAMHLLLGRKSAQLSRVLGQLENAFLSCEGLIGWDPAEWEWRLDFLSQTLPRESQIILTLREPRAYLYSTFVQRTLHSGIAMKPEDFFVGKEADRPFCHHPKVSMEKFNIARLIDMITTSFPDLEIVLFDEVIAGKFLGEDIGKHEKENHSLGNFSFRVLGALDRVLSFAGLGLANAEVLRSLRETALLNGGVCKRSRFPLRPILSRLDSGSKIPSVFEVIDGFDEVLVREKEFYQALLSKRS